MRRADDLRHAEQDIILGRLLREHIERRAAEMAAFEGGFERGFIDELAARAIDEPRPRLHFGQRIGIDDMLRLRRQRRVQRNQISAREEIVELGLFNAQRLRAISR